MRSHAGLISCIALVLLAQCSDALAEDSAVIAPPGEAGAGELTVVAARELAWLAGRWTHEEGEFRSEHVWEVPRAGILLGWQQDSRSEKTTHTEFMLIRDTGDGLVLHVYPIGQAPTDFRLVWADHRRALFENPQHDFPQRILYWLEGADMLVARIEGRTANGIRASEWRWQRAD